MPDNEGRSNERSPAEHTKPMLAGSWEHLKEKVDLSGGVYAQPKLDGIRCLARADGLWTRNGKTIVSCPHIEAALQPLFDEDPHLVLDGELYNHDLKHDFNEIASLVRRRNLSGEHLGRAAEMVQYHVYDRVGNGTFGERTEGIARRLMVVVGEVEWVPTFVVYDQESLDALYSMWLEEGYEGMMVRLDEPYEHRRSKSLMKRKEFLDDEFTIVRLGEGIGGWSGAVKRVVCLLPDGREFEAGIRGTYERGAKLLATADEWVGRQATVRFNNYTPDGVPRFGVVVALHEDDR